ncbi:HAMP domain-containing protein [Cohnella nanjingensis]|uniref:histidine kinase n=2 Tax=Cohnella nanjingensis TaxID=1387779 RepID=A0A7X0RWV9_9BACL|nr:HAMP domain-containing protein [Cohnella nanjingensis]
MSREVKTGNLERFLENSTGLSDDFALTLFDDSGKSVSIGLLDGGENVPILRAAAEKVLQGEIYKSYQASDWFVFSPVRIVVGVPLAVEGKSYALFLKPKPVDDDRRIVILVLSVVLLIGSALILIASRYIVGPIKQLTRATHLVARGNFNINMRVKRKDELGLLTESFNHMAGELKQLEQMRQDFVSNVSHEIQSPLTSIRGFSKALKQQPDLKEEVRDRYLGTIERESERLSRLVDNLLQLASLESDHHPFHFTTFELDEQLRRAVLACEPQWANKRLEIRLDLPKVKLTADADQMNQVWINLLSNAIKFTPPQGVIHVSLTVYTDKVTVTILDSGIGIAAENKERIFERFYKADASRQRKIEGSGLGLAIVRKIIHLHNGSITVKSDVGKGTEFTIILPNH